jgi:hypothetical protein
VLGLAASRFGILGNLKIKSAFAAGAAAVSSGLIGDATGKTLSSCGTAGDFLAADGSINQKPVKVLAANLFANALV